MWSRLLNNISNNSIAINYDLNECLLILNFQLVGKTSDQVDISLTYKHDLYRASIENNLAHIELDVLLPTDIIVHINNTNSGKGFVELVLMSLDDLEFSKQYLASAPVLHTKSGNIITGNIFVQSGTIHIRFDKPTVFLQMADSVRHRPTVVY